MVRCPDYIIVGLTGVHECVSYNTQLFADSRCLLPCRVKNNYFGQLQGQTAKHFEVWLAIWRIWLAIKIHFPLELATILTTMS